MKTKTIIIIAISTIFIAVFFTMLEISDIKKHEKEANEREMRDTQELIDELHKRYGDSMEKSQELEEKYRGDMQLEPIPDN